MSAEFYQTIYMPHAPRPHQAAEFEQYRDHKARALLWTMRTGKSKAMIDLVCYLFTEQKIASVLTVAPNGVHYNWIAREIPTHKWYGTDFNAYTWKSKNKSAVKEVEALLAKEEPFFFAVNTDSLVLPRMLELIKKLLKRGPALLIVDESHHFRTPGAKRTKRLRSLARHFKYVRILTGSSVDNTPFAAYSQFELLGQATLGFSTFSDFKEYFGVFAPVAYGARSQQKVTSYKNQDFLKAKIESVSTIVGREGLSEFVHTTEFFEMHPKQAEAYKTIKKDLLLTLDSGQDLRSPEAGAKLIKLQQISSGFIIDESKKIHHLVSPEENPRLLKLKEVLETVEGKSIIWCKFQEDLRQAHNFLKTLGITAVEYHGSIKEEARQIAVDRFQKDARVTVFLGQPAAGGEGLNLSAGSNVIWYSHTFDAIQRNQASERATTSGGKSIALIDICAMDSLDIKILADLGKKKITAEQLVTALREL